MSAPVKAGRPADGAVPPTRPPNQVVVTWAGDQRFEAGRPDGPTLLTDGMGTAGQSPVDLILSGLAACAGIDVVEILAKRRTPVERMEVNVTGARVETTPRRLRHVMLEFRIDGAGIERGHAERAIGLSVEKYCSVKSSLARDIGIEWELRLNGEATG